TAANLMIDGDAELRRQRARQFCQMAVGGRFAVLDVDAPGGVHDVHERQSLHAEQLHYRGKAFAGPVPAVRIIKAKNAVVQYGAALALIAASVETRAGIGRASERHAVVGVVLPTVRGCRGVSLMLLEDQSRGGLTLWLAGGGCTAEG